MDTYVVRNSFDIDIIDNGGKCKIFQGKFLQPGFVQYNFGLCLLEKENADKFVYKFVGCPLVVDHQDVTDGNVSDVGVGNITRVWYNDLDGWYWCEGAITDSNAVDLIKRDGYSISCQYEITDWSPSDRLHNGVKFDKYILDGAPEHLAIVKNPRYEGAMIAVNKKDEDGHWVTIDGEHVLIKDKKSSAAEDEGKGAQKSVDKLSKQEAVKLYDKIKDDGILRGLFSEEDIKKGLEGARPGNYMSDEIVDKANKFALKLGVAEQMDCLAQFYQEVEDEYFKNKLTTKSFKDKRDSKGKQPDSKKKSKLPVAKVKKFSETSDEMADWANDARRNLGKDYGNYNIEGYIPAYDEYANKDVLLKYNVVDTKNIRGGFHSKNYLMHMHYNEVTLCDKDGTPIKTISMKDGYSSDMSGDDASEIADQFSKRLNSIIKDNNIKVDKSSLPKAKDFEELINKNRGNVNSNSNKASNSKEWEMTLKDELSRFVANNSVGLKDVLRRFIANNKKDSDGDGRWVTIKGTHVFIPDGKSVDDVMKEKGWGSKKDDLSGQKEQIVKKLETKIKEQKDYLNTIKEKTEQSKSRREREDNLSAEFEAESKLNDLQAQLEKVKSSPVGDLIEKYDDKGKQSDTKDKSSDKKDDPAEFERIYRKKIEKQHNDAKKAFDKLAEIFIKEDDSRISDKNIKKRYYDTSLDNKNIKDISMTIEDYGYWEKEYNPYKGRYIYKQPEGWAQDLKSKIAQFKRDYPKLADKIEYSVSTEHPDINIHLFWRDDERAEKETNKKLKNKASNSEEQEMTLKDELSRFVANNGVGLKDVLRRFIANNKKDEDGDGRWVTIKGTHVFIKDGQSVEDAMKETFGDKESLTSEQIAHRKGGLLKKIDAAQRVGLKDKEKKLRDRYDKLRQQESEIRKQAESLKGKYERDDAEFDEEQVKKDIEVVKRYGYTDIDEASEFLGLDPDEYMEITGESYED